MPAILVSVKKDTWKKMKQHPEIKWTQVMRHRVEEYLDYLEGSMTPEEVQRWLGPELSKAIDSLPQEDPKKVWKEIQETRWRRQQSLTRVRVSKEKQDS